MNWHNFWNHKASYSGDANQVARIVGGKPTDGETLKKIAPKIAQQLDLNKEDSLLDVCCGNGALSKLLLPYCKEISGIDFSEKLIEKAGLNPMPNLQFYCADAAEFKLNRQFNKVILYFSFQYFEDYLQGKSVIENLLKHAGPGAVILIGDITDKRKFFSYYNSPGKIFRLLKQKFTGKNDMGKFWHPAELDRICRKLGVKGKLIEQEVWQPYSRYRFDYIIRN